MVCKKCKGYISKYTIDRVTNYVDVQTYKFKLCWGCGYFSILPNISGEFTDSIMEDRTIIMELIEDDLLKPIL